LLPTTWSIDFYPEVPLGYDQKGNPVPVYVYPEKASGGLFSSIEDITRFVIACMPEPYGSEHDVLGPDSIKKLYTPVVDIPGIYGLASKSYGLGHFIEDTASGKKAIWHGGQGDGWMTHFHSVPEEGAGIVIFTNSSRSWPFISYILGDWAKWNSVSSVGFTLISKGVIIAWVVIGMVLLISLFQLCRLGRGLFLKKRKFAPLSKESLILRLVEGILSVVIFCTLPG